MINQNPEVRLPAIYGNEEETGLMVQHKDGAITDPNDLCDNISAYTDDVLGEDEEMKLNGGKLYAGWAAKAVEADNLEYASAEHRTPRDLVAGIRSGEVIRINTILNYLRSNEDVSSARMQRRVVDSYGNRKACHDSFGFLDRDGFGPDLHAQESLLRQCILGHLVTRNFLFGAGHASPTGTFFSQKINGLSEVDGYGFFGSMLRVDTDDSKSYPRLEIRCNDINISDFAAHKRIGMSALAATIGQAPSLARRLINIMDANNNNAIKLAKAGNQIAINPDGTIEPDRHLTDCVDYQEVLANIALVELENYVDEVPEEFTKICLDILNTIDDFKKIIAGEETIELLADRLDWAYKFMLIIKILKDNSSKEIDFASYEAMALDLKYDIISLCLTEDMPMKYGYGLKKRDRGKFRDSVDPALVRFYSANPPKNTRASLRVNIMKKYRTSDVSWGDITVKDHEHEVELYLEPDQTELTTEQLKDLAKIKRIA